MDDNFGMVSNIHIPPGFLQMQPILNSWEAIQEPKRGPSHLATGLCEPFATLWEKCSQDHVKKIGNILFKDVLQKEMDWDLAIMLGMAVFAGPRSLRMQGVHKIYHRVHKNGVPFKQTMRVHLENKPIVKSANAALRGMLDWLSDPNHSSFGMWLGMYKFQIEWFQKSLFALINTTRPARAESILYKATKGVRDKFNEKAAIRFLKIIQSNSLPESVQLARRVHTLLSLPSR